MGASFAGPPRDAGTERILTTSVGPINRMPEQAGGQRVFRRRLWPGRSRLGWKT